jgi:hypothetical protein
MLLAGGGMELRNSWARGSKQNLSDLALLRSLAASKESDLAELQSETELAALLVTSQMFSMRLWMVCELASGCNE